MDRFTRNYAIALGVIVAAVAAWWVATLDFSAAGLNGVLADDPLVAGYVYRFKARTVRNGVAEIYTPRSAQMPATRFLGIVRPELAGRPPDHPELVAAEQELARVQARARELALAQPDVNDVRWVLDRDWFERRGVML